MGRVRSTLFMGVGAQLEEDVACLMGVCVGVWICGVVFTKLATGVWFGDRPEVVVGVLLLAVFLGMHWCRKLTFLIRILVVLSLMYVVQVLLISPGDFFLKDKLEFLWSHVFVLYIAMNVSFLVSSEHPDALSE